MKHRYFTFFNNHYDHTNNSKQTANKWNLQLFHSTGTHVDLTPLAAQIHGHKRDIEEPWSPTHASMQTCMTPLHSSVTGSRITVSPDSSSLAKGRQRQTSPHLQVDSVCIDSTFINYLIKVHWATLSASALETPTSCSCITKTELIACILI